MYTQTNYVKGYRLVFGYIGNLILLMSVILLLPLLCVFFYHDEAKYIMNFVTPSIISLIIGLLLSSLVFKKPKGKLQKNQDAVVVVLGWIIYFIIGSLPFYLKTEGETYTLTESIFEVVSGFTTTGITMVDVTNAPKVYLLYRSITLFFGGVGIIIALIGLFKDNSGMALYNAEGHEDRLMGNLIKSTRAIMIIYVSYVLLGFILYLICGMTVFDAINHSISSLATGGFSTKADNIGHYNSVAIELVTMFLMLLGGINFFAHLYLIKGKPKNFFRYNEIKTMFIVLLITIPSFTLVTTFYSNNGLDTWQNLRNVSFHFISALTGTGFELMQMQTFEVVYSSVFIVTIVLMIFGGNSGSTSGGIKCYRLGVIVKNIKWQMSDLLRPGSSLKKVRYIYRLDGREYFDDKKILKITSFVISYIFIIVILALIFCASINEVTLGEALFEGASLVGTVGLSLGIVQKGASTFILWTGIFGMFLGRLEIQIIVVCFIRIYKDSKRKVEYQVKSWEK